MQKPNSIGARVNGRLAALIAIPLVVLSIVVVTVWEPTEIRHFIQEYLSVLMLAALGVLLFSGYPVAVILEGEPRHKRVLDGPEVTDSAHV